MVKKFVLNIVLLIGACLTPWYLLYIFQGDTVKMEQIQVPLLFIIFIGSSLLIYLNNKYRKQDTQYKWSWLFFIVVGIVGLLYSGFVLFLILSLRNCCGF
jgi:hypothetical protein